MSTDGVVPSVATALARRLKDLRLHGLGGQGISQARLGEGCKAMLVWHRLWFHAHGPLALEGGVNQTQLIGRRPSKLHFGTRLAGRFEELVQSPCAGEVQRCETLRTDGDVARVVKIHPGQLSIDPRELHCSPFAGQINVEALFGTAYLDEHVRCRRGSGES